MYIIQNKCLLMESVFMFLVFRLRQPPNINILHLHYLVIFKVKVSTPFKKLLILSSFICFTTLFYKKKSRKLIEQHEVIHLDLFATMCCWIQVVHTQTSPDILYVLSFKFHIYHNLVTGKSCTIMFRTELTLTHPMLLMQFSFFSIYRLRLLFCVFKPFQ